MIFSFTLRFAHEGSQHRKGKDFSYWAIAPGPHLLLVVNLKCNLLFPYNNTQKLCPYTLVCGYTYTPVRSNLDIYASNTIITTINKSKKRHINIICYLIIIIINIYKLSLSPRYLNVYLTNIP